MWKKKNKNNTNKKTTFFRAGDEKDRAVTKAYESLLLLTLRQPDNLEYKEFAEEVKRRAERDYNYKFSHDETVSQSWTWYNCKNYTGINVFYITQGV